MQLEHAELAPDLQEAAQAAWRNIIEGCEPSLQAELEATFAAAEHRAQLAKVLACSPYAAEQIRRHPQQLLDLIKAGTLHRPLRAGELSAELAAMLASADVELGVVLRRLRQRHMLRIIWRDFCKLARTLDTTADVSELAECCIAAAQEQSRIQLEARHGVPRGRDSGEPQELIVVAMGKLGARELNLSSDVDLIFAYPEAGQTDGVDKPLSNEEFFTRLGRAIIAALDPITAEGFVFRVDMRLRPYGESGALVHNFAALEAYYQEQGRDWERYAMIKGRPITGESAEARRLEAMLRPFVYRRYVDFGVIESLRNMKGMITAEVRRRSLEQDVKLGHGGIREVEFIAQCFQLIRGGRDIGLQQRELLPVLDECEALGCLPSAAVAELKAAYCFLRDSEHAIQGYEDKQTQALPGDQLARLALAAVMGCADWDSYRQALDAHRATVSRHFDELIAPPEGEAPIDGGAVLWGEGMTAGALAELGFQKTEDSLARLEALAGSQRIMALQAEGKERLEHFMPQLLRACAELQQPDLALERVLPLVVAVARRSAYLVLLMENPPALDELALLCERSPWIAEQLEKHPVLLDELLDRTDLYSDPDRALLAKELEQQVARLAVDDLEAQMDALRYFRASHILRVAASELTGRLPLMKVSDKLTWIAEVILEQVLQVAWADLCKKYGEPARESEGSGLAIFGYGKLGGIELGHGSDLDLVFVSDAAAQGVTGGERSIDNALFYTRLGQRMIHILETRMALGQLYEIDMRLRPSGESGMLVTTARAFRKYQRETAWTWEHQALVRARFVAGDPAVAAQVEAERREILCQPRDPAQLAREVVAMRHKMREHLLSEGGSKNGEFHLKQGLGGIVDIEFMVQYAVLAWSHRVPELARWSDNVRILETLGREGLFAQSECDALTEAYLAYRSAVHQLSLQQQPGVVPDSEYRQHREAVTAKWQQLFAAENNEPQEEK